MSAGVYNSPAIRQRSGIGRAAWLAGLGVEVAADFPVGRNLLLSLLPFWCRSRESNPDALAGSGV